MKKYRKVEIESPELPCLLKDHIFWLVQQYEKLSVEVQSTAQIEITREYDDISTTLSVLYERLETEEEEEAREDQEAQRSAVASVREKQAAEDRRKSVMVQIGEMSPEEKREVLTYLKEFHPHQKDILEWADNLPQLPEIPEDILSVTIGEK